MLSPRYLETTIINAYRTAIPRYGMNADGYTSRRGVPTSVMVRLEGEKRHRRLMVWQFSNAGTWFLRIKGEPILVRNYQIPV